MANAEKKFKICPNGHQFYKTSDCPVCPICEQLRKPGSEFLAVFSAPARRALEHIGIETVKQLSNFTQSEIMQLHGMGPASLPKLQHALQAEGLSFKKSKV